MTTALVSIQERIKNELKNINKTTPSVGGRNISTKGKVFTLPDGVSSNKPLEVIILGWRNFNQYFSGAYNPTKPEGAKCFAIGGVPADMAPHEAAPEPQSESCAICTFNQWGSSPVGKGKACKNQARIAVITADPKGLQEPLLIKVSPTGLKSWGMHASTLAANDLHPIQVITEISFDANQTYPTLVFKSLGEHGRALEDFTAAMTSAEILLDTPPVSGD